MKKFSTKTRVSIGGKMSGKGSDKAGMIMAVAVLVLVLVVVVAVGVTVSSVLWVAHSYF